LAFLEWHWGSSEHALNGRRESAELQLYHYDPYHASIEEALQDGSVLALSILFQVIKAIH